MRVEIESDEQWPVLVIDEPFRDKGNVVEIDHQLIMEWRRAKLKVQEAERKILAQALERGLDRNAIGVDALLEEHGL